MNPMDLTDCTTGTADNVRIHAVPRRLTFPFCALARLCGWAGRWLLVWEQRIWTEHGETRWPREGTR